MATYQSYSAKGIREDLANIIENISPEETPVYSAAMKGSLKQSFHEWQTDVLAAADKDNALVEGADATLATPAATTRIGNYSQISGKDFAISGSMEAFDKAGRKSEIAYQLSKQGKELRTDIEAAICQNNAAVAGNSSTARKSAGLETFAWAVKNHGTSGSTTTVTAGAPTTAPTDGTQRAFTEPVFKDVLQQGFNVGVRYKMAIAGGAQKQVMSGFSGLSQTRLSVSQGRKKQGAIVGAADIYVSDFGDVALVPSTFVRNRTVTLLDPEYIKVCFAPGRKFKQETLAKTGDAEKRQIITEWTLEVGNPRAVGKAADLT